jgi:hypothetical protein
MAKPGAEQIGHAATKAGFRLSAGDVKELEAGRPVPVAASQVNVPAAAAGCSGIKIADLGGGCGLYFTPFPPMVSVCCQG